jgi:hypothetical protein
MDLVSATQQNVSPYFEELLPLLQKSAESFSLTVKQPRRMKRIPVLQRLDQPDLLLSHFILHSLAGIGKLAISVSVPEHAAALRTHCDPAGHHGPAHLDTLGQPHPLVAPHA